MNALEKKVKELGLEEKANQGKADKAQLIADIGKATTIAQLKVMMIKLVQMLDK